MREKTSILTFTVLLLLTLSVLFLLSGCKKGNDLAGVDRSSASDVLRSPDTATPVITPSTSPVPPESLTDEQKRDKVWTGEYPDFGNKPSRCFIFYLECNGQGRLVWVEKESNPPANGFDLLDVFNQEVLFHVSIQPEDQVNVTPSEFPKYVDRMHESLQQYSIVAAAKLLDINDLYTKCNIDLVGADTPYDVLFPYFSEAPDGSGDWSKKRMLDAFIAVTPAQYILPIWEYVPNAVTPNSYFNPPSPTPVPIPDEFKELLLGIGKNSEACKIGTIEVYNYELKGNKYRCWAYSYHNKEKSIESNECQVSDIFEIFTGQYLFSISLPNNGIDKDGQGFSMSQSAAYMSETNPALKGMKLVHAFGLLEVALYYQIWEVDYNNDAFLNGLSEYCQGVYTPEKEMEIEEIRQVFLSVDEMKEHFLNSTPQEEILPYWVYTPGAQIPEELKGIYSEEEYPPAPAE